MRSTASLNPLNPPGVNGTPLDILFTSMLATSLRSSSAIPAEELATGAAGQTPGADGAAGAAAAAAEDVGTPPLASVADATLPEKPLSKDVGIDPAAAVRDSLAPLLSTAEPSPFPAAVGELIVLGMVSVGALTVLGTVSVGALIVLGAAAVGVAGASGSGGVVGPSTPCSFRAVS